MKKKLAEGVIPWARDVEDKEKGTLRADAQVPYKLPWLSGQVAGAIKDVLTCREIVEGMVNEAGAVMNRNAGLVSKL